MQTISCLVCCREVTVICPSCPDLANQQALLCMPGQVSVVLSQIFYLLSCDPAGPTFARGYSHCTVSLNHYDLRVKGERCHHIQLFLSNSLSHFTSCWGLRKSFTAFRNKEGDHTLLLRVVTCQEGWLYFLLLLSKLKSEQQYFFCLFTSSLWSDLSTGLVILSSQKQQMFYVF